MKSIIRFGLLCVALICFSNMAISQKRNKKKVKTSISSKKKKPSKKTSSKKKKSVKKNAAKKRPTTAKYVAPVKYDQLVSISNLPSKSNLVDSTPEKVINIVSAFKPQLKNIAKIGFLNATAIVDTNTVILSYQVPSQNLSFQYQPIALVPRAIKKDSLISYRQTANFKIGMGNYFNQLLQGQFGLLDQKNQQHNLVINNASIEGAHPVQKWNSFGLNYTGAMAVNQHKNVHSQIYFNQSKRYRYGLVPDTTNLPLSNFEQKFSIIGANLTLTDKMNSDKQFQYTPTLTFNHGNLIHQAKDVNIEFNSPIFFKLKNEVNLHADLNVSFNQFTPFNKSSTQNYFVQLNPSIALRKSHFQLNMGVRPTYSNGSFALYPKFELVKQLKDTNIILEAGWKTILTNNQLVQLLSQNHWMMAPNALPISSNETKYFQVAIKANKRLNYGFNMSLNDYRELPFFNQTRMPNNPMNEGLKFDVLFEKRAIAIELKGDLRYQLSDKLLWKNHFKYIQFNLIRENDQAWGILPFEFNSQLDWFFSKKMQFDASGQFWTGSKTSAGLGNAYQLNNTFVLNAGLQYAISDNWTFWGKGENLLDQQYQRWANYPSLGVQFLAGIQYKFSK